MKADSDPTNGHDENDTLGFDLLDDSEAPCNQTNERQNRSIRGGRMGK